MATALAQANRIYDVLSNGRFERFYPNLVLHFEDEQEVPKDGIVRQIIRVFDLQDENPYLLNTADKIYDLCRSFGDLGTVIIQDDVIESVILFEDWHACMRACDTLKSLNCFFCVESMSCQSNNQKHKGYSTISLKWKR